jgi:hypothetical protein
MKLFNIDPKKLIKSVRRGHFGQYTGIGIFCQTAAEFLQFIEDVNFEPTRTAAYAYLKNTGGGFRPGDEAYEADVDETVKLYPKQLKTLFYANQTKIMLLFINIVFENMQRLSARKSSKKYSNISIFLINNSVLEGLIDVMSGVKPIAHINVMEVLQREAVHQANIKDGETTDSYVYSEKQLDKDLLNELRNRMCDVYMHSRRNSNNIVDNHVNERTVIDALKLIVKPVVKEKCPQDSIIFDYTTFSFIRDISRNPLMYGHPDFELTKEDVLYSTDYISMWANLPHRLLAKRKCKNHRMLLCIVNMIVLDVLMNKNNNCNNDDIAQPVEAVGSC